MMIEDLKTSYGYLFEDELHTSRVVTSRLLKKLEIQGKIELNRNNIKINNL
jgi:CRP/FNR family transcriptional regulator